MSLENVKQFFQQSFWALSADYKWDYSGAHDGDSLYHLNV